MSAECSRAAGWTHPLLFVAHVHLFECHHFSGFPVGRLVHRPVQAERQGLCVWLAGCLPACMAVRATDQPTKNAGTRETALILPVCTLANDPILLVVVERLCTHHAMGFGTD